MGIFDKVMGFGPKQEDPNSPALPIKDADQQPLPDRELCDFVKKQIEEVRAHANRVSHEGIWMTNIAYLLGFDSVYYDPQLRQFRPTGTGSAAGSAQYLKRNRIHSNQILPAVQNRLARMLKNPPKYDVRPNSMDEDDKEAAKLSLEQIDSIWDKQAINRKRIDLGMWIQECGHSFVGVCWDQELGDEMMDPETGEMMPMGDIRIDIVPAFEAFADPLAKTMDECSWFARAKVRKLDYFRNHFPDRGDLVKEEGVWLLSNQYEMRINTLNSVASSSSGTSEQMKNAAIEINYYEKKSPKHKKGRHIIVANGVLLKNDELPVDDIPYAKFDDVVIGGKFYSESLITHGRPLQDQYNRTLVKRAEWVNKLLAGKYIAARGHGLAQEAVTDQSGEVVEYDPVPGAKEPAAMELPVIPSYAYEEADAIKKDLNEIFGLSEVSRGQLPSASIPAVGIQLLLEQDETRIGIEVEQHEHAWAKIGQLILKYTDKYYVMDRKMKTKGNGLDYQIKTINGDKIKKNFDAIVVRGSTIPNSKVLERQEILNLYGNGLLGNPQDPQVQDKVLGMLQYGDVAEVWEDQHLNASQVQRDIEMLEVEVPPPVNLYDDHSYHFMKKNRYRKSEKYDQLSPLARQLFEANMKAHMQMGAMLANPQLSTPPNVGPEPMPAELANAPSTGPDGASPSGAPADTGLPTNEPPPRGPGPRVKASAAAA
jgi:hypothetical protein